MRRLLFLVLLLSLTLSVGCKDDKVVAPKEVPAAPKGPPTGLKQDGQGDKGKNAGAPVSP